MEKFITGLKYGTWSTRLYVISIPVACLLGVGAIITAFILNVMLLFLAGVAAVIGGIALVLNYDIEESQAEQEVRPETIHDDARPAPKKEKRHVKRKRDAKKLELPETDSHEIDNKKKEAVSQKETSKETPKEPSQESPKETTKESSKDTLEEPHSEEQTPTPEKESRTEELLAYDEKAVKRVFHKYKVKEVHKTIMIDSWEDKGIKHSPAYTWVTREQLHILVMGANVEEYILPMSKVGRMTFKHGVICQAKEEYVQFRRESLLATVFSPYLPVYHEGNKNNRPVLYKNLFAFDNGLMITNTSMRNIVELIHPQVELDDIMMRDVRYNDFFKEVYKLGTLFREQVYSVKEYQNLVNDVLHNFAAAGTTRQEYEDTLQALRHHKLITEEYIQFYLQYWEQHQRDSLEENGKHRKKKEHVKKR